MEPEELQRRIARYEEMASACSLSSDKLLFKAAADQLRRELALRDSAPPKPPAK